MKEILFDQRIDQKFKCYDGKPYVVDYYEVTKAPDNIRCMEDLMFLVVRKYNIPLASIEGSDKEDADPLKSYVIKTPFVDSVIQRMQEKYTKWLKDPASVELNEAELEFFKEAVKEKNSEGVPKPLARIGLNIGLKN